MFAIELVCVSLEAGVAGENIFVNMACVLKTTKLTQATGDCMVVPTHGLAMVGVRKVFIHPFTGLEGVCSASGAGASRCAVEDPLLHA